MNASYTLLRIALGWLFFYAGITKVLDPNWTAAGYLRGAKTLGELYHWFALPNNIWWVDLLNEWGLTIIGLALLLGVSVRLASGFGILLMFLYYLPILSFPLVGGHSYLVDEHIIYILVLAFFMASRQEGWGMGKLLRHTRFFRSGVLKLLVS